MTQDDAKIAKSLNIMYFSILNLEFGQLQLGFLLEDCSLRLISIRHIVVHIFNLLTCEWKILINLKIEDGL
jgi:hypothetical protein